MHFCGCGGGEAPSPVEPDSPEPVGPSGGEAQPADDFYALYGFDEELLIDAVSLHDALSAQVGSYQVIDIRSYADWWAEHIPESVNIPSGKQFELRVREVEPGKVLVLVSNSSYAGVARTIECLVGEYGSDLQIYVLRDGLQGWMSVPYPVDVDPENHC